MSDNKTASEQLAEAIAAAEKAAALVETLKEQTRAEDLETVKRLIGRHGFTQTDLRSVLKAKSTRTSTPRKSTRRKAK
jgi:hypothetical protein